jgi:hypothetical protein
MSLNITSVRIGVIFPRVYVSTALYLTHQAEMCSPKLGPRPSLGQIVQMNHYFSGRHGEQS